MGGKRSCFCSLKDIPKLPCGRKKHVKTYPLIPRGGCMHAHTLVHFFFSPFNPCLFCLWFFLWSLRFCNSFISFLNMLWLQLLKIDLLNSSSDVFPAVFVRFRIVGCYLNEGCLPCSLSTCWKEVQVSVRTEKLPAWFALQKVERCLSS